MDNKKFNMHEANVMFVLIGIVLITLGAYVQTRWLIPGLLITQYGIILLPVLLLALFRKKSFLKAFRFKKLPIQVVFKIIGLAILFIPIVAAANLIVISIIDLLSEVLEIPIPVANNGTQYVLYMFVISITAGICEEFFFRGMVLGGYQNSLNLKSAAIWSALMFGFFHFNPQNLVGPILLGLIFAYLVQITGSLWAGVVAHMANNGIAVSLSYIANLVNQSELTQASQDLSKVSSASMITAVIFLVIIFIVASIGVRRLIQSIKRDFPRFKVGEVYVIQGNRFKAIEVSDEKVYFEDVYQLKEPTYLSYEKLKQLRIGGEYRLWENEKFHVPFATLLTFVPILIIYGMIVYQAYIRG